MFYYSFTNLYIPYSIIKHYFYKAVNIITHYSNKFLYISKKKKNK